MGKKCRKCCNKLVNMYMDTLKKHTAVYTANYIEMCCTYNSIALHKCLLDSHQSN